MKSYLNLVKNVMEYGDKRMDRTKVGTKALFHQTLKFDLYQSFPAVTVKKLAFQTVAKELEWMLSGERYIDGMQENGCHIWDDDVAKHSWQSKETCEGLIDAGRTYGVQWRHWQSGGQEVDQLRNVVETIKTNPADRRMVVTAWNPGELDQMCLPPCHMFYQFFVRNGFLDCAVYMRSVDVFLGLPFDIASYGLLTAIVATETGLKPGRLMFTLGDTHLYDNHTAAAHEMLMRTPMQAPQLMINPNVTIDTFKYTNVRLNNWASHGPIKAKLNVGE